MKKIYIIIIILAGFKLYRWYKEQAAIDSMLDRLPFEVKSAYTASDIDAIIAECES